MRRVSQGNGKKKTNQFILYQPSKFFFIWTVLLRPVTHLFMILNHQRFIYVPVSYQIEIYTHILKTIAFFNSFALVLMFLMHKLFG